MGGFRIRHRLCLFPSIAFDYNMFMSNLSKLQNEVSEGVSMWPYGLETSLSLSNNPMGAKALLQESFNIGSKVWNTSLRVIQGSLCARLNMGWPLEARRSLYPDWLWLCDESLPHRRALHIPVQILAGKFKMEFLPTENFPCSTDLSELA